MGCICALEREVRNAVDGKEEIGMGMVEVGGGGGGWFCSWVHIREGADGMHGKESRMGQ